MTDNEWHQIKWFAEEEFRARKRFEAAKAAEIPQEFNAQMEHQVRLERFQIELTVAFLNMLNARKQIPGHN